jgi:hypothetical protein
MANEIDMCGIYLSRWNERFEHGMRALRRTSLWEQTEPRRHPVDVGINWEGRMSTGEEQDAGDRLWPHTAKFCQEGPCGRHRHFHQLLQTQITLACSEGAQNLLNALPFQLGESA